MSGNGSLNTTLHTMYLYIFIIYFTCSIPFFLPLIFNFSYHPIFSPFLLTTILSLSLSLQRAEKGGAGGGGPFFRFRFRSRSFNHNHSLQPPPPPQPSRAVGGGSSRTSRTSRTSSAVVETKYAWQLLRASTDPRNYEMILKVSANKIL